MVRCYGMTIHSMSIQNNGMIVVAGNKYTSAGKYVFALARYNTDGSRSRL